MVGVGLLVWVVILVWSDALCSSTWCVVYYRCFSGCAGEVVFICLCPGSQRRHEVSSSLGLLAVYPFPSLLIPSYLAGLFSGG